MSDWLDEKYALGLDFPNLPYLIDGDLRLSQTNAILLYLADKAGLSGRTPEQAHTFFFVGREGMRGGGMQEERDMCRGGARLDSTFSSSRAVLPS